MHWTNEHNAGLIPLFLSEHSSLTIKEQLHINYAHGGGWRPFEGFELVGDPDHGSCGLAYPGDPVMMEVARCEINGKYVLVFEASWVAIVDGESVEIARMD